MISVDAGERGARGRILDAASSFIAGHGIAELSMQQVANEAGVSKALIHYHFTDKEKLLAELVSMATARMVSREERVLAGEGERTRGSHSGAAAVSPLENLWSWVEEELNGGERAMLAGLRDWPSTVVQEAVSASDRERAGAAVGRLQRLASLFSLRFRAPIELVASVEMAFLDGLAVRARGGTKLDELRAAFDLFWLALLGVTD